ncbi:MAG: hypothetical protein ABWW63_03010 [Glaciecola sp.]
MPGLPCKPWGPAIPGAPCGPEGPVAPLSPSKVQPESKAVIAIALNVRDFAY